MIYRELERVFQEERQRGANSSYIRNALKEYLQVYVLYFIYTSKEYSKNLIFTGGTCLRHFFGLDRLSEDIDFDYQKAFKSELLLKDLMEFFRVKYKYSDMDVSVKQKGRQILLKFPVLKKLGLARRNESDLLYVKVDLSGNPSKHGEIITTSESRYGFNYAARHYDLPALMSGKVHAVLMRRFLRDKDNREAVKGRDYYDLLWFVKKGVRPNIERLSDMLNEKITMEIVGQRLDEKVERFVSRHKTDFKADITPLVRNPEIVKNYVDNYHDEYVRYKDMKI